MHAFVAAAAAVAIDLPCCSLRQCIAACEARCCIPCQLSLTCCSSKRSFYRSQPLSEPLECLTRDGTCVPHVQGTASLGQTGGQAGWQVSWDQLSAVGGQRSADGCRRRAMPHSPTPRCAARRLGRDQGAAGGGECAGLPTPNRQRGLDGRPCGLACTLYLQPDRACLSRPVLKHSVLLFCRAVLHWHMLQSL